jgi:hypothetical protein
MELQESKNWRGDEDIGKGERRTFKASKVEEEEDLVDRCMYLSRDKGRKVLSDTQNA